MNIEQIYSLFKKHPVIRTDSRKVTISSLFFALSGDNFDGNEFVLDAIENGAAYCIIDNPEYKYDERCILVHNTLKTLQDLAKHHRNHIDIPVIGITGTNGKTTTKELIREVLSEKYRIKATSGNLNNHIGVPLTLLSINKKDEIAIIEMGANHTGEIEFLCDIANPEYGIITNLGIAHLEGFIDFDGVKKTKKELYNHIRKNNGKIILNLDDSDLILMANEISNLSFGEDHNADIHISDISANPYASLKWNHINKPKNNLIKSNLIGRYNYSNIMAAVGFGILFGVPDENINAAINNYTPKNMRSQYLSTESNKLLIDAYNANPTSMKAALQNFDVMNAAAKCMILGEMMELGIWAEQEHEILVEQINKMNIKEVFLVGDIFKTLSDTLLPSYKVFSTTKELSSYLEKNPLSNKTILLKGSRGNKLESLIEKL